jgi:L-alanine-DL-glutamate epimerase-like enolase superfamily enzyme
MRTTDITICDVQHGFEHHAYRTPLKFGGQTVTACTVLNVTMTVETRAGKVATGFGSMPLNNTWSWPSATLSASETLEGMKQAAGRTCKLYCEVKDFGHPIHHAKSLEPRLQGFCEMPHLAVLVVNSAFDAAMHDAYGKVHGLNCYQTYGPPFFDDDLSEYLDERSEGQRLHQALRTTPRVRLPLYHLVGALDPLTPSDVLTPVNDGHPEHLEEWIVRDGLTHLKIKLNGDELRWDVERILNVDAVAEQIRSRSERNTLAYSLDFNERCPNVEYLLEVLHQVKDRNPRAYDRVQYIEQPTSRDLDVWCPLHAAAKLKPIVVDEGLIDFSTLLQAINLGYTGVAFKACKGQSSSLMLAAAAEYFGLFLCVQDLTCPGASLIHSAGLAAHIPGVQAIEANSRQYLPAANEGWNNRFPGVFEIRDGTMHTGQLTGLGLGAVPV